MRNNTTKRDIIFAIITLGISIGSIIYAIVLLSMLKLGLSLAIIAVMTVAISITADVYSLLRLPAEERMVRCRVVNKNKFKMKVIKVVIGGLCVIILISKTLSYDSKYIDNECMKLQACTENVEFAGHNIDLKELVKYAPCETKAMLMTGFYVINIASETDKLVSDFGKTGEIQYIREYVPDKYEGNSKIMNSFYEILSTDILSPYEEYMEDRVLDEEEYKLVEDSFNEFKGKIESFMNSLKVHVMATAVMFMLANMGIASMADVGFTLIACKRYNVPLFMEESEYELLGKAE